MWKVLRNNPVNQGAENFWTIPEYGEILFWGDKSLGDYEKELETLHNIPPPSIYRYPRCRQFKQVWEIWILEGLYLCVYYISQIPTDSGVCHTFNGRSLDSLLKPSSWLDAFKWDTILTKAWTHSLKPYSFHRQDISISSGAFKTTEEVESEEVFKSVGIDKEGGLVFTLDTLQVHLLLVLVHHLPLFLVHHHLLLLLVHHQCNQNTNFRLHKLPRLPLTAWMPVSRWYSGDLFWSFFFQMISDAGPPQQILDKSTQGWRYPSDAGQNSNFRQIQCETRRTRVLGRR